MKLENTLANKAKFFALYWGQLILFSDGVRFPNILKFGIETNEYLELTPLSQITDEDAIEVAKIVHQIYSDRWNVVRRTNGLIHIELKGNVNDIYHVSINTFCCSINANHHFLKTETDDRASFKVNIGSVNSSSKYPVGYYTVTDFLRRKGYYVGDGTEIEYGWVKLKEDLP